MVNGGERLASAFATQAGNPKSQAPNPKQIRILEVQSPKFMVRFLSSFEIWGFEVVSDLAIRISDLRFCPSVKFP